MEQWVQSFKWDFPYGGWGIAATVLVALLIVVISYRYTLRQVSANAKIALTVLRMFFILFIIFCLCRPRIERKRSIKKSNTKKIAVLTDISDSMRLKGFWQKSRLNEAMDFWREKVKKGDKTFHYEFYTFGEKLNQIENFKSSPYISTSKKISTNFYKTIFDSCDKFSTENFDGIIYMSDAIDTSGSNSGKALNALAASSMKHIFVPMKTKLPSKPYINFRKLESPSQAFIGTEIPILIMTQQTKISPNANIKIKISKNDKPPFATRKLRGGSGIQTLKFRLPVRKSGLDVYKATLEINDKKHSEIVWSITKSIKKESAKVLVYQGALDWGTRFLRYVFAESDKVKMDIRYAPEVYDPKRNSSLNNFPSSSELKKYDVVVLFNLNRKQITSQMEQDLKFFVKNGGGLFFLNGNPVSVKEFAASQLEELLPVTFDPNYQSPLRSDAETRRFLRRLNSSRNGTRWDTSFRRSKEFAFKVPELKKFILSKIAQESPIFKFRDKNNKIKRIAPVFQDLALVKTAKPGANILAYGYDKNNYKKIIMAYQNYGKGRSMVLATDPLWRWRMNSPSTDKSFENFWKNLFFWLAQGQELCSCWQVPNLYVKGGERLKIFFEPGREIHDISKVTCSIKSGNKVKDLALKQDSFEPTKYYVSFVPEFGKKYILRAISEKTTVAGCIFASQPKRKSRMEEMILKPDIKVLRDFATLENVYIEDPQEGFDIEKYFSTETFSIAEKETFPLWHRWWIFAFIVGFFVLEMVIRRVYRLV